jgi:thioredoxin reductase (NADPH)
MTMRKDEEVDCLVVGGGPAGLTAAIYLARFRRKVLVIDDNSSRASLIPTTHNYPGFVDGISGIELLKRLRAQANQYGARLHAGHITDLEPVGAGLRGRVGSHSVAASKVILATGIVDEKPALPNLREFIYRGGVRFCPICDGYEATGKRIAVIGMLKDAINKALFLRTYSRSITLLPMDDPKCLSAEQKVTLRAAGIPEPIEPLADLLTEGSVIEAVMAGGARIELDVLYPAMGARVRSELATNLGARANDAGCIIVDEKQRTSVQNLYAAGDITLELHQLAVAFGQAVIAATDIHKSLLPNYC